MSEKNYKYEMPYSDGWREKTGPIEFKMTNDYLFRILLQRDEKTLRALVANVLQIGEEAITDIEIINPIEVGDSIDEKEYHLDVNVVINANRIINLEMQAVSDENWKTRSLLYVCRAVDNLSHGESYIEAGSVIQISFTDFTLFEDEPEFFSKYMITNVRNSKQVYTDKIAIYNVNLKRIDLAKRRDKKNKIDHWASMFKAKTWEDIKMLATKDKNMEQAASSIWQLSEDEKIREQIRRREANEREYNRLVQKANRADVLEKVLEDRDRELADKDKKLADRDKKIADKDKKLADDEALISEQSNKISELEQIIFELRVGSDLNNQ